MTSTNINVSSNISQVATYVTNNEEKVAKCVFLKRSKKINKRGYFEIWLMI